MTKVVDGLIRRGLAERIESDRPAVPDLVCITTAGLEAIGVETDAAAEAEVPDRGSDAATRGRKPKPAAAGSRKRTKAREGTKQALMIEMLRRKDGATVDQIAEATGWKRHTIRGAIAGALKKKLGLNVESEKVEGRGQVYRIDDQR